MFQVMIVDDEKAIRENLPALINFEAHGFRVCGTAKNGQDALEKWESCRPDVIFLDVRMPVMDGLTFLGKLQERTQTLPDIVMLSGYSDFEYARTAMRYGVRAYLTKPVDEEEVEALLEELSASLEEKRRESKKTDIQEQVLSVKQMYHNGDGDRTPLREYRLMHCVVMDDSAIQEEAYRIVRETIEDRLPGGAGAFCRNRGSVLSYLISPRALEEYQYSTSLYGRHLLYQLKKQKLECALLFDGALFGRSEGTFRNDYDQHLYQMMTEIFWGGQFSAGQFGAAGYFGSEAGGRGGVSGAAEESHARPGSCRSAGCLRQAGQSRVREQAEPGLPAGGQLQNLLSAHRYTFCERD